MAIKELFGLINNTMSIQRNGTAVDIHAGYALGRSSTTPYYGVPADRNDAGVTYIGIAADDAARTGNTFIQADPVGSNQLAADGTFTAGNNAWFDSVKRALGDYQDETVSNVSDLVSGSTGYQGPRRGLSYFPHIPGTQFIIDGSCLLWGYAASDNAGAETDTSTWAVNDYLTECGTLANLGKWCKIPVEKAANIGTTNLGADAGTAYGAARLRIDAISGSGSTALVTVTME